MFYSGFAAAAWKGAILVSAPSMQAIGNESVGLHLYTSSDEDLANWVRYQPSVPSKNGDDCVICPASQAPMTTSLPFSSKHISIQMLNPLPFLSKWRQKS